MEAEPPTLGAQDVEVVVALIERAFQRFDGYASGEQPVLLSDLTMVECENAAAPSPVFLDCFAPLEGRMEIKSHAGSSLNLKTLFEGLTPHRLALPPIEGVRLVGDRVPAVPGQLFAVSAPVHLSQRQVAIFFRAPGISRGVAYLVREKAGWALRDLAMSAG